MPKYDQQLRAFRAQCKHSQMLSFKIRLDPAGQPKERASAASGTAQSTVPLKCCIQGAQRWDMNKEQTKEAS